MRVIAAGAVTYPDLNEAVRRFVSERLWGRPDGIAECSSLGVFDGHDLIAGVLYHNWQPDAAVIELSAAALSKRWLARPVLREMFGLPFGVFGCQMVVLRVSPLNLPMVAIAERFGFDAYRIPRLRGRHEDEIIFTLTKEQWERHPLLKERQNGQANSSAPA